MLLHEVIDWGNSCFSRRDDRCIILGREFLLEQVINGPFRSFVYPGLKARIKDKYFYKFLPLTKEHLIMLYLISSSCNQSTSSQTMSKQGKNECGSPSGFSPCFRGDLAFYDYEHYFLFSVLLFAISSHPRPVRFKTSTEEEEHCLESIRVSSRPSPYCGRGSTEMERHTDSASTP